LLLGRQRLALSGMSGLLGIVLSQPAPHGAINQILVAAHLAHAQALVSDQLHHLQLEGRVEGSTGTRCHVLLDPRWG
jgi:hypothetical protein